MKESGGGQRDKAFALSLALLGAGLSVAHAGFKTLLREEDPETGSLVCIIIVGIELMLIGYFIYTSQTCSKTSHEEGAEETKEK